MATEQRRDDGLLGDVQFHQEIDPVTGFAHNTTILPAGPVPLEPQRPTFLQCHPYFGPIIGWVIGARIRAGQCTGQTAI